MRKLLSFLHDLWQLAKPYWSSGEKWVARSLLVTVIALDLGTVAVTVQINQWQASFFNALENKNQAEFMRLLAVFGALAFGYIVMAVYQLYLTQMLQIKWRRWLTERYLDDWLQERIYYRMQLTDRATDNPDQRIAEDLNLFVATTLTLSLGLLNALVTLGSFLVILWGLSGEMALALGGSQIIVPGYLVWVALIYATAGTWLAHVIGRPLVGLNFQRQRFEADFRFSLVRFRENAEAVALYAGENDEKRGFMQRFQAVAGNWWEIMRRQKKLTWFQSFYGQLAIIFPYVVVAPRYFSGAIQLGGLMQTASAFGQVQTSLSWFIDAYARLADWKATVDRLLGFRMAVDATARDALRSPGVLRVQEPRPDIETQDVQLRLPDARVLLDDVDLRLAPGEPTLITGPSGSGKSTLFRALAGIWPFGQGEVRLPEAVRLLFLPQRPYLPLGSLRAVLSYPAAEHFDQARLHEVMRACGLEHLQQRLDDVQNWAQALSGGEQQRVAFARALLHRPDWLFLDEASSALDEAAERALYGLLKELPGTTLVSIGHRPGLRAFHARRLAITRDAGGVPRLVAVAMPIE
ncbi:MAG: ABC transporter ATP-binding protein/permease [Burkholderiales bacterium]|nr:ABC transporter ATP-binding protein/permease [Burkholderiales bacterium]